MCLKVITSGIEKKNLYNFHLGHGKQNGLWKFTLKKKKPLLIMFNALISDYYKSGPLFI